MDERGQSTVETVGMLPMLVVVALAVCQLLAAGVARELADHAAEAGAVAMLEGGDPEDAARAALPGWAKERVHVAVHGSRVRVRLEPPAPLRSVAVVLAADAEARAAA